MRKPSTKKAEAAVAAFNAKAPIGTPVRYWKGLREGDGAEGTVRSEAYVSASGDPVVFIHGCSGYMALSHVEVLA